MQTVGIDIGTTTVSMIVMDGRNGKIKESRTIAHEAFLKEASAFHKVQDAEKIWELVRGALQELTAGQEAPAAIGLTGQMHGMLYVDAEGEAVSPLYTWQDGCGNIPLEDGRTAAEVMHKAGMAASGYGLVTHYYLMKTGQIPAAAAGMTTISDYIGMKLCGSTKTFIAGDMAASWGCFDLKTGDFNRSGLKSLGVDPAFLPELMRKHEKIGETKAEGIPAGIPVIVSLGDNQASVIGSVQDLKESVLINIGTGSQVSFGTAEYFPCEGSIELRPCTEDTYIMVGSGLCGGRAYAMLEKFYREAVGAEEALYDRMLEQAEAFLAAHGTQEAWKIRTTFSGTRSNPAEKGSIAGIGIENFCPGAMTAGMILGILEELHEEYEEMCRKTGRRGRYLIGSGNGIRRNPLMKRLAEEMFGMPLRIPQYREEAACGAALNALAAIGAKKSLAEAQQMIAYC